MVLALVLITVLAACRLNQFAPSQIALVELLQALVAIQQTCVLSIIRILSTHLVVNGSFAAIRKLVVVRCLKIHARLTCFACSEGHLPCAHSLAGCPAHTCSTDAPLSQRRSCTSSRGQKCSFDPTNTSACSTPLCGQPRVSPTSAVCSDCTIGRFPCTKLCSRRCDLISTPSAAICE